MPNNWSIHVKKTMEEMKKAAPKGVSIMLKDVLKKAKLTYKKGSSAGVRHNNSGKKTLKSTKKRVKSTKTKKRVKSSKAKKRKSGKK
jgi:hypothetical protein